MAVDPEVDPRRDPLLRDLPEREGFVVLDRVVLYQTLGRGGFAVVYRGRHLTLDVDVAVKCLKPDLALENEQFVLRFQREAQQAARINHPNVVRVYDVHRAAGVHYLVMELVEGEDARARVQRKGPLAVDEAVQIALGGARGLAEAHRAGLVHRDVKPDNLLISARGEVKVADLGIAKPSDQEAGLTASGQIMGTPQYMPPEQFRDLRSVTPAADVYALGATLYYLLTGQEGIRGGSLFEILARVRDEPFPDVRERRPDVPEDVAAFIARCTEKDAERRPRDGGEALGLLASCTESTAGVLEDGETGSLVRTRTLVSPPPAHTLERIRVGLRGGESGAVRASSAAGGGETAGETAGEAEDRRPPAGRRRARSALAATVLGVAGLAGWWALSSGGDGTAGARERVARQPERGDSAEGAATTPPSGSDPRTAAAEEQPQGERTSPEGGAPAAPSASPPPVAVRLEGGLEDGARVFVREQVFRLAGRVENPRADQVELERSWGASRYGLEPDGAFALALPLVRNESEEIALRAEGLAAPLRLALVHDDEEPSLEVVEPAPDARRVAAPSIDLALRVDDRNLASVRAGSRLLARGDDGLWRAPGVALGREGENAIPLSALDHAGNAAEDELVVARDTRGPALVETTPEEGASVEAGARLELELVGDEALASATVAGRTLATDGRRATGALEAPGDPGRWRLEIELEDALGNRSEERRELVVEAAPPAARSARAPEGWNVLDERAVDGWARRVEDPRTGVAFVLVEAGSFEMGSPAGVGFGDERPLHRVTIPRAFYLAETEVTQDQWARGVGTDRPGFSARSLAEDPSHFEGDPRLPVEQVSWDDSVAWCQKLGYRLLTEAEWEYACRAGTTREYSSGDGEAALGRVGWYSKNSDGRTHPVGEKEPNAWGLFDMHGNVWEWVQDRGSSDYSKSQRVHPAAYEEGGSRSRVFRGGSCWDEAGFARSACRSDWHPVSRYHVLGFRPALSLP